MADQENHILDRPLKCGYTYFWFEDCNHAIRFQRHIPNDDPDLETGACNQYCNFDGSEENSYWFQDPLDALCSLCADVDIEEDGAGDAVLYDLSEGDPPEVFNPAQRCNSFAAAPANTPQAAQNLPHVLWDQVQKTAVEHFQEIYLFQDGPGRLEKGSGYAGVVARETGRAAAVEAVGEYAVRGNRRDRFNARRARQALRIKRRQHRWIGRVQTQQRRLLKAGEEVSVRPYIIADLKHPNSNTDLMTSVPPENFPEEICSTCRGPLDRMDDVLETVLLKNQRAEKVDGKVNPFGVQKMDVVRLPCGHYFHFDCINYDFHGTESDASYICPVCRMGFSDVRIVSEAIRDRYPNFSNEFQDDNDAASSVMSDSTTGSGRMPHPDDEGAFGAHVDGSSSDDDDADSDDSQARRRKRRRKRRRSQRTRQPPASAGSQSSTGDDSDDTQAQIQRLAYTIASIDRAAGLDEEELQRQTAEIERLAYTITSMDRAAGLDEEFQADELAERQEEADDLRDRIAELESEAVDYKKKLQEMADEMQRMQDDKAAEDDERESRKRQKIVYGG